MDINLEIENAKRSINEGRCAEAKIKIERIVSIDPDNKYAHFELAKIHQIQGNDDLAAMEYKKVLLLDSAFYPANFELARIDINEGRYNEAKEILEKVVSIDPDNKYVHFELARIHQLQGNDALAEKEYKKVLLLDNAFHAANLELARMYYRQRRMELSFEQYSYLVSKSPNDPDIYKELGTLSEDMGSPEKALDSLKMAVNLCPENPHILFEYARLLREAGEETEAVDRFKKVLEFELIKKDKFLNNKVLNELEITQKKEVLESKPRAMIAMILDRCNIKCRICDIWAGKWQARDEIIREIMDLFPYMEDICWQGGEVFMMKGFDDVLREGTKHKNLRQVIFTNGLMINEKILEKLGTGKVDIVFSIDAVDKETYEYIRHGAKYERLVSVLKLVREFKKSTGINLKTYFNPVIMKSNYKQLEAFVEFGKKYEFDSITFTPIRGAWGDENVFDAQDREAIAHIICSLPQALLKAKEYGIRLNNWLPGMTEVCSATEDQGCLSCCDSRKGPVDENKSMGELKSRRMICYAPWQRLLIDCEGPVRPFGFCGKEYVGNVNTMSLAEIWNGDAMMRFRRKIASNDYDDICQPECISGQVRDKICKID